MADVLFVSKLVAPPWNDSSKNLVRDIAGNLQRHTPTLMGREGQVSPIDGGQVAPVYGARTMASFSPGLRENFDVLRHLLWGSDADIWHFFFAPNPRSTAAGRFASAFRRVPCVHTVCSMPPDGTAWKKLLFADVTVALSRFTYDRLRAQGVSKEAVRLIPPSVPALPEPSVSERSELRSKHGLAESAPIWIYPGDLEHGGGAEVTLRGLASSDQTDAVLLMACRDKTPRAAEERARLIDQAKRWGVDDRVRWVGETPHIHELLALSDFVLLPNSTSFAKMDYPLVVLEAMCMARPVVVGAGTPATELAEDGGAVAVETNGDALAEAVEKLSVDRHARTELGREARALALRKFSPREVAATYERVYEEIHA
jgi:glycosyltransferase involved in cell wall biosynthesis